MLFISITGAFYFALNIRNNLKESIDLPKFHDFSKKVFLL